MSAVLVGDVVSSVLGVFATDFSAASVDVVAVAGAEVSSVVGSVVGSEVGEFSAVDVGVVEGVFVSAATVVGWLREGAVWACAKGLLKKPVFSSVSVVGAEAGPLVANRRLRKSNGLLSDEVEDSTLALPLFSLSCSAAKTVAISIKAEEDHNNLGNMVKERQ